MKKYIDDLFNEVFSEEYGNILPEIEQCQVDIDQTRKLLKSKEKKFRVTEEKYRRITSPDFSPHQILGGLYY